MNELENTLMSSAALVCVLLSAALLAACSLSPAKADGADAKPVAQEQRSTYYQVKKGDTLYSIALAAGQDYRDVAAWNGLADANVLSVGQTLRIAPPEGREREAKRDAAPAPNANAATASATTTTSDQANKKNRPAYQDANDPFANLGRLSAAPATPATTPSDDASSRSALRAVKWARPSRNKVLSPYLEGVNRGIDFDGAIGDPIVAAAAGKVTLVTNTLRGYGNLIVIKHDANFISVYAHASKVLVHEGEVVTRGQRIGDIGSSDSDRAKLHFEIRLSGRPMDPATLLPPA